MDDALRRAVAAGWDPKDGRPPYEHGEFVDGLDASDDPETLLDAPDGDAK